MNSAAIASQSRSLAGSERFDAKARFLQGEEFEEHWSRLVSAYPIYARYHSSS